MVVKTLHNTKAKVKVNQSYTAKFEISSGVKQVDPLSATLFIIVVVDIIKQLELRGDISTRLKQSSAYADHIRVNNCPDQTNAD